MKLQNIKTIRYIKKYVAPDLNRFTYFLKYN